MTDKVSQSMVQFISDLGKLVANKEGGDSRWEEIPRRHQKKFKQWGKENVSGLIKPHWRAAWRLRGKSYILELITEKIKELEDAYLKEKALEEQDPSGCNVEVKAK